ncbi:ABC transporter permease [Chengkuizengella axinellae]|uniref:ABC transporter permease n=1 Tax=Chengkuizengella axinellae TaxID=3064388 RepID=A0ABT9J2T4_9BACL|nr:ABC transporter permease [Chengkuizengella sp. 2205SS18-9]MDP5275325.1 ABC transporter permease [Chengkuizengella sp. 2205SS18-9]
MNKLFTVAGFTIRNKMKTKAFIITTLIIAVIMTIGINIPYFVTIFSSDEPTKIGFIEDDSNIPNSVQDYYQQQDSQDVEIILIGEKETSQENEKLAMTKMENGEIEGFIHLKNEEVDGFPIVMYTGQSELGFNLQSELQNVFKNIKTDAVSKQLGLSSDEQNILLSPVSIESLVLTDTSEGIVKEEKKNESEEKLSVFISYAAIILLFMGIMISGQLIATEITTEKSSRVMEILVTSVPSLTQMFGKIIGMFIVSISQIIIFVAVIWVNIMMPHNVNVMDQINLDMSTVNMGLILGILFYVVLLYFMGFFLYATLFAAVGSIVSRTEDLGQAIMPVTFTSIAGFYIAIFSIGSPDSALVTWSSFIPFFTPFVMALRIGAGDPAGWEIWLSIGILLVSILGVGWLSAKIYRTGVLMYGKRPSIKELRKAMKAFKV